MTILIVGASGATGKHLVGQLLISNQKVKAIVRSAESLPKTWRNNGNLTIIERTVLDISLDEMGEYLKGCNAVASCLGHNLTFKGIYGKPRRLVTDSVKLLCKAIEKNASEKPVKVVLMNTAGNRNKELNESISFGQKLILALIRLLLPPHVDNEKAAAFLQKNIGQNYKYISWAVVRPDGLIDEDKVSEYAIHPSPTRSAIFNAGEVSRINVGHFMSELIIKSKLWAKWKGQMPVIYNSNE
ncbi:MAG: hypothetical protein ACJAZ3_000591 [Sphingobacteriales bacterium]|jgi:hypothetical protein